MSNKVYPLTDKLREAFRKHAINCPELEAELESIMIPKPDKPKGEIIDTEPIIPVIEEDSEKVVLRNMYPKMKRL